MVVTSTLVALLVTSVVPVAAQDVPAPVWRAYRQAIIDTRRPSQGEVVHDLVRLTGSDPRVRWRTINGRRYVLVATLRRSPLAEVTTGAPFTLAGEKWVVMPRQLRKRCARVGCATMGPHHLDLTLKQFIGVPPDADYKSVNMFWVRPRDMFRPCFRADVRARSCPRRPLRRLPGEFGAFLREQAQYSWRVPRIFTPRTAVSCASAWPEPDHCYGFPWTRLGYTYDWARGRNHVGLTEFVVRGGAAVYLQRVGTQQALVSR